MTNVYVWVSADFAAEIQEVLTDITFHWRLIPFDSLEKNLFYIGTDKFPKKFHNKLVRITITKHSHVNDHSDKIEYSYTYELELDPDQKVLQLLKNKG